MGCGCDSRRDIMFTQGNPDFIMMAIMTIATIGLVLGIIHKPGGRT